MNFRLRIESWVAMIVLTASAALAFPMNTDAEETPGDFHTFTGPNGGTLEAEVLEMREGIVLIRRISDSQEFQLQANRLVPQDVTFMRAWLAAREASTHPLGWKRLRVRVPEFVDQVEAPGIPSAFRRIDEHTWEAELPDGAWVLMRLWREGGSDFAPQFLLPYRGERDWFLTFDGSRLHRATKPNETPALVGVTIATGDGDAELKAMKSEIPADGVSLFSSFVDAEDMSALRGARIISLVVTKLPDFSVAKAGKVRALRVTGTMSEATGLSGWDELECLEFPLTGDFPIADCAKLKGLTTLVTDGDVSLDVGGDGVFPMLRHLSLRQSGIEDAGLMSSFLEKLPKLESLELPDFYELDVSGMAQCTNLTAIELGNECLDPAAAGVGSLKQLSIALLNRPYPIGDLAETGQLAKLRVLGTGQSFDLSKTPVLKTLRWLGGEETSSLGGLTAVSGLSAIEIHHASTPDLEALVGLGPQLTGVKSLRLKFPITDSLSVAATLPNLQWLGVTDQLTTFDQKLVTLDAIAFPALKGMELARLQNLTEITLGNSELVAVSIRSCDALEAIKAPAIDSLVEVVIANAKSLRSTGQLLDGGGVKVKRITGSPGIGGE